jgi:hypothetical protein
MHRTDELLERPSDCIILVQGVSQYDERAGRRELQSIVSSVKFLFVGILGALAFSKYLLCRKTRLYRLAGHDLIFTHAERLVSSSVTRSIKETTGQTNSCWRHDRKTQSGFIDCVLHHTMGRQYNETARQDQQSGNLPDHVDCTM